MQSIDSSPLEPHVGGIWSVNFFFISSFSFCRFLPACFNFQDRGKLQIQRHPEAGDVQEVCLYCATLPGTDSPRLLVLRGHVQAPDQAVGLTQPTSTSCPHIQAETKPCTGCFPAKLPGETVDDQSTLTAAAAGFGFLGSGNTGKSRGWELFYSDACKECDSFLYSSVNTLAR